MFDLSRLSDIVGGFFNEANPITASNIGDLVGGADGIHGLLSTAGIDIDSLAGLTQDQVANVLTHNGIDPASLSSDDITQLMQHLGLDSPLVSAVSEAWGNPDQGAR